MFANILLLVLSLIRPQERPFIEIEISSLNNDTIQFIYQDSTKAKGAYNGYHGFIFKKLKAGEKKFFKVRFDTLHRLKKIKLNFGISSSNYIKIHRIKIYDGSKLYFLEVVNFQSLSYNQHITKVDFTKNYGGFETDGKGSINLSEILNPNPRDSYLELYCKYKISDLATLRYTYENTKVSKIAYKHVAKGSYQKLVWPLENIQRLAHFRLDLGERQKENVISVISLKYVINGNAKIWNLENWDQLKLNDLEINTNGETITLSSIRPHNTYDPIVYMDSKILFENELFWHKIKLLLLFFIFSISAILMNKKIFKCINNYFI